MDINQEMQSNNFQDGAKHFKQGFDPELIKPYKNGILVFADPAVGLLRLWGGVCC